MLYSNPVQLPPIACKQYLYHLEGNRFAELFEHTNYTTKKSPMPNPTTPPLPPSPSLLPDVTPFDSDESDEEYEYCEGGDNSDDEIYPKNGEYYFNSLTSSQICYGEEEEEDGKVAAAPFWYSHEEVVQIREIFSIYQKNLIKEKTRSEQLFVGKITRHDVTSGVDFQTFDEVFIYNEQIGNSPFVPFERKLFVVTTWEGLDGLPSTLFVIDDDEEDCLTFWRDKVQRKAAKASTLYCEPHFYAKYEYIYFSSSQYEGDDDHDLIYHFGPHNSRKSNLISWC